MAGETNLVEIVKATAPTTVSRAPAKPDKEVEKSTQGKSPVGLDQAKAQKESADATEQSANNKQQYDAVDVAEVVEQIEVQVQSVQRDLKFSVDNDSGDTVIKVIDGSTDEVIRQIPSEEFMAMRERIQSFTKGSLLDDEA